MPYDYEKGRSGTGAPNYSSSAWRAGDLERTRLEREKIQQQRQHDQDFFITNNTKTTPYYGQSESDGEGCFTALFSFGSYIIVFSLLYKAIPIITDFLSKTGTLNISEWLPSLNIVIIFGLVVLCRKFIGRLALLSIVIFIGSHYFYDDAKNQTRPINKPVYSEKTLTKKQRTINAINAIKDAQKDKITVITPPSPISKCRPCALIINSNSVSANVKNNQRKICEPRRKQCANLGVTW